MLSIFQHIDFPFQFFKDHEDAKKFCNMGQLF